MQVRHIKDITIGRNYVNFYYHNTYPGQMESTAIAKIKMRTRLPGPNYRGEL